MYLSHSALIKRKSPPPSTDAQAGVEVVRIGSIVGGVIGGIALILVALGAWWWIRRRDARRAQNDTKTATSRDEEATPQRAATDPPPMYSEGRGDGVFKHEANTAAELEPAQPARPHEVDSVGLQIHEMSAEVPKKDAEGTTAELSAEKPPQEKF